MKINFNKKLLTLITTGVLSLSLVGCSIGKKIEKEESSSTVTTIEDSTESKKEKIPMTIYDAYYSGDMSICKIAQSLDLQGELPKEIKYTRQEQDIIDFVNAYKNYIKAHDENDIEAGGKAFAELRNSNLFKIETYAGDFKCLKGMVFSINDNEIDYVEDNKFLPIVGIDPFSVNRNIFTFLKEKDRMDQRLEENWAKLFSMLPEVLTIDPASYNLGDAAAFNGKYAYTEENLKKINDDSLLALKVPYNIKYDTSVKFIYDEEWKVVSTNDKGDYQILEVLSTTDESETSKENEALIIKLSLITKINNYLAAEQTEQAFELLNKSVLYTRDANVMENTEKTLVK